MEKFLKKVFKFTLFSSFSYVVFIFIWGDITPRIFNRDLSGFSPGSNMYRRINDIKNYTDIDILFLGSSHAHSGYDTRIFKKYGISSFNLGSSAQSPINTEILVNKYIDNLNPKCVILDIYPMSLGSDGIESMTDIITHTKIDKMILKNVYEIKNLKLLNTLIYNIYKQNIVFDKYWYPKKYYIDKDYGTKYISGGYIEREIEYFKRKDFSKRKWGLKKNQFYALKRIKNTLKNKNIKLLLVQAPITKVLYESYINNEEVDSRINKINTYLNFNEIISLNDTIHFEDSHHLNQLGVEIFNKELIEILFKTNFINLEN